MGEIPALGFAARSGTGKTTLLRAVLPYLQEAGLRVGMIKHAHHDFDVDKPGKDSYELRKAGARQMLVASDVRWALMTETPERDEPVSLPELLDQLDAARLDLVLVEGFRQTAFPKLETHRPALGKTPLFRDDPNIIAVITDGEIPPPLPGPVLDLNNPASVAGFIQDWLRENHPHRQEATP